MKLKLCLIFFMLIFVDRTVFGQEELYTHTAGKALPFPDRSVALTPSWIKQREALNTAYLLSLDPDRLLHNFRVNAGLHSAAQPLAGWEAPNVGIRGHFTGHYLSAVSMLVEKYRDTALTRRLTYMVDELYKCQQALGNGYLSAFPEKDFDTLEKKYGGVWAPYYTFHKLMQGLLDVYVRTGNKIAYKMVNDMASYVEKRMSKLSSETIDKILYTTGANPPNEAGAMNEVLYKLYKVSHNPEHLALARLFDRDWFLVPLSNNKDILSGLHSNTHIVLVNGFAQRYAITGEALYHNAVQNFWDILIDHHAYANGSSSGPRPNVVTPTSLTSEHWGVPDHLSNTMTKEIAESCVSHNTQKLTAMLFCWDGDPKYADAYMNTFYNSTMALQNAETGAVVYHLPLGSPQTKKFLKDDDFRCCNGTSIEAFAALHTGIYYHNDSTLWVNMYIPSKVNWQARSLSLEQGGSFPTDSVVEFTLTTEKTTTLILNFLIPGWSQNCDVYINGQEQGMATRPGSYLSIRRAWKDKDKIRFVFHYAFYLKAMPDDENVFAIFYGPLLLAAETDSEFILKGRRDEILKNLTISGSNVFRLKNGEKTFVLRPLYAINNQSYGVYATIREPPMRFFLDHSQRSSTSESNYRSCQNYHGDWPARQNTWRLHLYTVQPALPGSSSPPSTHGSHP